MRMRYTYMMILVATLGLGACGGTTMSTSSDGGDGDMTQTASGTKKFGDVCNGPADCMQGLLCESFAMHTIMRCTKSCTTATQATDCPPPSAGTCTPNMYCRFAM
jgi:hypothetical protein